MSVKSALRVLIVVISVAIPFSALAEDQQANLSDEEIRQQLIQNSINSYSGSCPCPYNRARNGSRCGKRSAWSRPGGFSPLCYPKDISDEQVKRYRSKFN